MTDKPQPLSEAELENVRLTAAHYDDETLFRLLATITADRATIEALRGELRNAKEVLSLCDGQDVRRVTITVED